MSFLVCQVYVGKLQSNMCVKSGMLVVVALSQFRSYRAEGLAQLRVRYVLSNSAGHPVDLIYKFPSRSVILGDAVVG